MLYELTIYFKKANLFGRVFNTHSTEVYRTEKEAKEAQSKLTKENLGIECESFTSKIIKHPHAKNYIIMEHITFRGGYARYKVYPND